MKLDGSYTFDAPQQMVWDAIRDPDVLGQILPGGEGIEETGENEYEGNLKIKVGPVNGKFKGNIKLHNINPPESYDIDVDGKGAPGFVKANGSIQLTGKGDKTDIDYSGEAKVGGRIASVGQRLLDTSAKAIVRQSLDLLNEYLKAKVATQTEAKQTAVASGSSEEEADEVAAQAEVTNFQAPSQAKLASDLARDVASEVVPRPVLYGVIALVVIIVLLLIFL